MRVGASRKLWLVSTAAATLATLLGCLSDGMGRPSPPSDADACYKRAVALQANGMLADAITGARKARDCAKPGSELRGQIEAHWKRRTASHDGSKGGFRGLPC